MDSSPQSEQHLDTNILILEAPNAATALEAAPRGIIDAVDNEIAELEEEGRSHDTKPPIQRIPDDILLESFFKLVTSAAPWPYAHPSIVASQVCHGWRDLVLSTPLLWTKIELILPLASVWEELNPPPAQGDFEQYLSLCRHYLHSMAERVRMFTQRSAGCPLQLEVMVYDAVKVRLPSSLQPWSQVFAPLVEVVSDSTTQWESIDLDLAVVPESSLALHLLRLLVALPGSGMRSAVLCLQMSSQIPESLWNEVLPDGKLDLRSAELHSLSVRMAYGDMSCVQASWEGLTTLTSGAPPSGSRFLPSEALDILRSTPNLIHCTIYFSVASSHRPPVLESLTLTHLESLTIVGKLPPRPFAEALELPSLTRLLTGRAMGVEEGVKTSAVLLWIEKYGAQLKEVSVAYTSLKMPAMRVALNNLPNVESLELTSRTSPPANIGPFRLTIFTLPSGFTFDADGILKELDPGNPDGCPCPRLRTLVLEHWFGSEEKAMDAAVDLVEKRRNPQRPESISRLDTLDITFLQRPPGRDIFVDLERKGVDTDGITIRSK
ncbi:hypothetical protein FA13DRAFT_1706197 [Coprinellus micaceus]|uniref:Uncharacterized protein n=1 Tax=Coprinellus micaceus TaxID=71717 RepID=A0A4Y7TSR9_COPMI|nr:hypothetical protein FA13DRAFT_1706197 [Coprinellus micaceus]